MLKSLSLISVSAVTLLATTQAHSHILCAPNNPQVYVGHQHNQAYTVQRIQPITQHVVTRTVQQNNHQQKHLQAQRARQQKALANQRRINQQRRLQAQRVQQQAAARKAQIIKQQQAAAQQARAARQQAALRAARAQPRTQTVVYRQPAQATTHYHNPAPVVRQYVPARARVSVQVNTHQRQHSHAHRQIRRSQANTVLHYPKQPRRIVHHRVANKRYHVQPNGHNNYQWTNQMHGNISWHN